MKALLTSFAWWRRFTERNGGPLTLVGPVGGTAITGGPPGLPAHVRTGRLAALSRQVLAALHLRLLDLAQYTVLLSPEGPGPYGVDRPFADFHDDASARTPEPSARRPLAGGRA